ncbi:MAG: hypothetical protein IJ538_03995 [Clostridia bacterium]|nr:hypothetical protein [Clostridia bacterium]
MEDGVKFYAIGKNLNTINEICAVFSSEKGGSIYYSMTLKNQKPKTIDKFLDDLKNPNSEIVIANIDRIEEHIKLSDVVRVYPLSAEASKDIYDFIMNHYSEIGHSEDCQKKKLV